jgi:hypothetical protein
MRLCREQNSRRNQNRIKIKSASTLYQRRDANVASDSRCAQSKRDMNITKRRIKKKRSSHEKKIEFRQVFRLFIDTSFKFWRLVAWTKNKNHKSRKVFKIFVLTRRNAIDVVLETIKDFSFKIKMLHQHFFLNTTKMNLNDLQTFNYRVFVEKSKINI